DEVNFANCASQGLFSVSGKGVLVYVSAGESVSGDATLLWFHRAGKGPGMLTLPVNPYVLGSARIATGGQTIALSARGGQGRTVDIWLHDLARGATSRFTFGPG